MNSQTILVAAAAWLIPGAGHLMLKRWKSGLLIAASCFLLIFVGLELGGRNLLNADADKGMLNLFHQVASLGSGLSYLLLWLFGGGVTLGDIQNALKSSTFEYGLRFVAVAGLLNYLAVLDAVDIQLRRKR